MGNLKNKTKQNKTHKKKPSQGPDSDVNYTTNTAIFFLLSLFIISKMVKIRQNISHNTKLYYI